MTASKLSHLQLSPASGMLALPAVAFADTSIQQKGSELLSAQKAGVHAAVVLHPCLHMLHTKNEHDLLLPQLTLCKQRCSTGAAPTLEQ